jgi:hypothetical protein
MDEYTTTYSDAARIESAWGHFEGWFDSGADAGYGTLGTALWRERCLARVLALAPGVHPGEARKLVASLSRHARWLQVDPAEAARKIHLFASM